MGHTSADEMRETRASDRRDRAHNRSADLRFQVGSRRYERSSVGITSNLAFADWPTFFPNAACTAALIDRLVQDSEIISIEGESYRKREAEPSKEATEIRRRKRRS